MHRITAINPEGELTIDDNYKCLLSAIKSKLQGSRIKAAISINNALIQFYWEVGVLIIEQQKKSKWGDKLFDALTNDLSSSFTGSEGFSKTNLKNMYKFATYYPNGEFGQAMPDQLSWTHHIVLLQSIAKEDLTQKQWYAIKTVENGWSYRQLKEQIKNNLYLRQHTLGNKTNNFQDRLPISTSKIAHDMLKDPYKFHFLTLGDDVHEKEIHRGLINHIKQFLMELGQGFALYGSHYPIRVSGRRYEIDLLLYNTKLHCYFVVEIKRGEFKPEHAGQLNFYLSAVDEQLKMPQDNQTIGLLLCERKDKVIAEYALKRVESPIGISEYQFLKDLPSNLNDIFPTIEEIEAELNTISGITDSTSNPSVTSGKGDGRETVSVGSSNNSAKVTTANQGDKPLSHISPQGVKGRGEGGSNFVSGSQKRSANPAISVDPEAAEVPVSVSNSNAGGNRPKPSLATNSGGDSSASSNPSSGAQEVQQEAGNGGNKQRDGVDLTLSKDSNNQDASAPKKPTEVNLSNLQKAERKNK